MTCYARFDLKTMWIKTYTEDVGHHWLRDDGAVVRKTENILMRNPSKNPRLFLAYAPNEDLPLSFMRNSRRGFRVPRQFKTPENAMIFVDKKIPLVLTGSA